MSQEDRLTIARDCLTHCSIRTIYSFRLAKKIPIATVPGPNVKRAPLCYPRLLDFRRMESFVITAVILRLSAVIAKGVAR